jgi:CHAD domain-containing protein
MGGISMNTETGSVSRRSPRQSPTPPPAPRAAGRAEDPRLAHLASLARDWKTELEKCLEDSGVETVHRIRTGTRRVEAMIDVLLREAGADNPALDAAAARWGQQLKKIRRAAAPVRDLDVHRTLLERFAGVGKEGAKEHARMEQSEVEKLAATPEIKTALQQQAEQLDAWLKDAREQRAAELSRQIERRLGRLDGLAADFSTAWQTQRGRRKPVRNAALAALDAFAALSEEMPMLDASNLHDFRKRAKKARYVTEAGGDDAQAKAVGRAIKRVQDAIGDWHDWLCLGEEAHIALGEHGQELSTMLASEVTRSFQAARRTAERMRGRLVGEWRAMHPARPARRIAV